MTATMSLKRQQKIYGKNPRSQPSGPTIIRKKKINLPKGLPGRSMLQTAAPCIFERNRGKSAATELTFGPNTHDGDFVRGTLPSLNGKSRMCFGKRSKESGRTVDRRLKNKRTYAWVGNPRLRPDGKISAKVRLIGAARDDLITVYLPSEIPVDEADDAAMYHNYGRVKSSLDGEVLEQQSVFREDNGRLVRR